MPATPKMVRQGDILLVPTTATAITDRHVEVPRKGGAVVLAEGELTGHLHAILQPGVRLLALEGATDRVLVADGPCVLVHEEHAPIPLAPGTYIVRRQREYDEDDGFALVAD